MDMKQPLSLFLVAILVASVFTVVGIASRPLQSASAQTVTIETSADNHEGMFFNGILQVIVEDDSTDDTNDSIQVEVTVDEDGGGSDSSTLTIADTSDGSQRFEFFLVHQDGDDQTVADPEAAVADIFDFGDGAADFNVTGFEQFDSGSVEIQYGDETVTIDYDESAGEISLDREGSYGSTSLVHLFIQDNDGNLDPTISDAFTVTDADLDTLFDLTGAAFVDDVTFDETGDNTASFEAILQLNDTDTAVDDELDFTDETVTMQLNEMAVYTDVTNPTGSTDTSSLTFEISDADGDVGALGDVTFSSELKVTVTDPDQNLDSDNDDTITDGLLVEVDETGGDSEAVDLAETNDNTGVFEIDLSNGELRISFLEDGGTPTANNGILELRSPDIESDLIISYLDPLDDDSTNSTVVEFAQALSLTPGTLSAPDTAGVNDEFTVTLNEPDLNDNPRTRDSYVVTWTEVGPYNLTRGGNDFSEIYTFEFDLDGEPLDFGTEDIAITLTETGINTGIFEFDVDMGDVGDFGNNGATLAIDDGSDFDISIDDFMADNADPDEDDVTITIGKEDVGVDFSRTTVPIPPEDGSLSAAGVGDAVFTIMVVNDPQRANQSNVEESFDIVFGDGPGEFILEVDGDDVNSLTIDSDAEFATAEIIAGVNLTEVMTLSSLDETGEATGVFEADVEFSMDGVDMDAQDWQDAEFTFTYHDDEGNDESGGFTFRGSDGIVTTDQPSAKVGTVLTITVEDGDLNLDDAGIDHFDSGDLDGAAGIQALLLIETEDDEIAGGVNDDTFDETGDDTGIFTATFVIGDDIQISDLVDDTVEQATNILITYEDEIDSTGGGGDEVEVNVPIVSSTGSIQVTPELVGPATKLTVLIVDADLDEDAQSIDDYNVPAGQEDTDDFFVSFASDRNEVGEGSPDIEETGPNTGVFMWTLELITDETACADDDLGDAEFAAEGGDTDATIGACPGDLVSVRYEDELTGNGGSESVSKVVEVLSYDPEFALADDTINPGDRVDVSISDPDANRDPDIADSLTSIRVRSDSDQVGEEFSALETGRDTGVFRLSFGTTTGTASGAISVKTGDDITVTYTDDFPADFEASEEDKDFQFVIPVGSGGGQLGSTTVTAPEATDPTGQQLDAVTTGQQVVLTTNVVNTLTSTLPFVALVEVRDSGDVTRYLAWQTGQLNPSGRAQVGLSWTPEIADDYTVRTFVISSLNNPQILSTVAESEITVS